MRVINYLPIVTKSLEKGYLYLEQKHYATLFQTIFILRSRAKITPPQRAVNHRANARSLCN